RTAPCRWWTTPSSRSTSCSERFGGGAHVRTLDPGRRRVAAAAAPGRLPGAPGGVVPVGGAAPLPRPPPGGPPQLAQGPPAVPPPAAVGAGVLPDADPPARQRQQGRGHPRAQALPALRLPEDGAELRPGGGQEGPCGAGGGQGGVGAGGGRPAEEG